MLSTCLFISFHIQLQFFENKVKYVLQVRCRRFFFFIIIIFQWGDDVLMTGHHPEMNADVAQWLFTGQTAVGNVSYRSSFG